MRQRMSAAAAPPPDRWGDLSSPVPGEDGGAKTFACTEARNAVEKAPSPTGAPPVGEGWGGGLPRRAKPHAETHRTAVAVPDSTAVCPIRRSPPPAARAGAGGAS